MEKESRSSQYRALLHYYVNVSEWAVKLRKKLSLVRKTHCDGDAWTDSGRLYQTDTVAIGRSRSPM